MLVLSGFNKVLSELLTLAMVRQHKGARYSIFKAKVRKVVGYTVF